MYFVSGSRPTIFKRNYFYVSVPPLSICFSISLFLCISLSLSLYFLYLKNWSNLWLRICCFHGGAPPPPKEDPLSDVTIYTELTPSSSEFFLPPTFSFNLSLFFSSLSISLFFPLSLYLPPSPPSLSLSVCLSPNYTLHKNLHIKSNQRQIKYI